MRVRKKKNIDRRLLAASEYIVPTGEYRPGHWLPEGFSRLEVELGCGKGRFITETALKNPDVFYIAIEREKHVMVMAAERAHGLGLSNILFMDEDAARLSEIFAEGEVWNIYINFCDPWPTGRHAKRRLTHRRQLVVCRLVLRPEGRIFLRTDQEPLFDFSAEEFGECGFNVVFSTRDLHRERPPEIMTEYEERFFLQGLPIYALEAAMGPLPDGFRVEKKRRNPDPVLEDETQ